MEKIFKNDLDLKKVKIQEKGETIAPLNVGDIEIKLLNLKTIKL